MESPWEKEDVNGNDHLLLNICRECIHGDVCAYSGCYQDDVGFLLDEKRAGVAVKTHRAFSLELRCLHFLPKNHGDGGNVWLRDMFNVHQLLKGG